MVVVAKYDATISEDQWQLKLVALLYKMLPKKRLIWRENGKNILLDQQLLYQKKFNFERKKVRKYNKLIVTEGVSNGD